MAATAGDGSRHYAYVFHSSELTRAFTADYVRFSGAAQRIIAERYEVGFLDNGAGLDELRLNNSGVDILDRTKVRLHVVVFGVLHRLVTEDDLEGAGFAPVKDGPVRLIRGERGGFAYGALFQERNEVDLSDLSIPGARIERVRFSWDFNAEVLDVATPTATTSLEASLGGGVATPTLTTYLDANLSEPVIIDGQPDEVPAEPVPAWRQVSHATGTIVFVADLSSLGGTQRNYYKDDGSLDSGDTGDGRSYGDAGFEVEDPNTSFSLDTKLLVLPPTFEDVGEAYADALATPPAVMAEWQLAPGWLGRKVHLPLVRR
ncbi:MAG: hypothetical protein MAG451_00096 [Anaerolineales bacterium]|nr:hypothetical protein [Anaerolineales bacterium]